MENRKCPAIVEGKECALALSLVEREVETGTDVYECPLGHRTSAPLSDIEKRKCPVLLDRKQCGLAVTLVERELETGTGIYECPLGHRTYIPLEPEAADSS